MKENKREGSTVTTIITALMFFLILAVFGKSVHANEIPTQYSNPAHHLSTQFKGVTLSPHKCFTTPQAVHIATDTKE